MLTRRGIPLRNSVVPGGGHHGDNKIHAGARGEYTVVGPNLDVLKAQQARSSSDERQEFTSPERLAIVTCDNAAKT